MKFLPSIFKTQSQADIGELITSVNAEVASIDAELPELAERRTEELLIGNMKSVDGLDKKIAEQEKQKQRLIERRQGLVEAQRLAAERESASAAERSRDRLQKLREHGLAYLKDYEDLAASIAQCLEAITAINVAIQKGNTELKGRFDRVPNVYASIREQRAASHTEIESWWSYPGLGHSRGKVVRSPDGSELPVKPPAMFSGFYKTITEGNESPAPGRVSVVQTKQIPIMVEPELKQREVQVCDVAYRRLDDLERLTILPGVRLSERAIWDERRHQEAAANYESITEAIIPHLRAKPSA